jgi:hypothetical protein
LAVVALELVRTGASVVTVLLCLLADAAVLAGIRQALVQVLVTTAKRR